MTLADLRQTYTATLHRSLFNRWFLVILGLKIVFGTLFASDFLVKGFAPFINYYVESGFQNPYDFFLEIGRADAFPYPPAMLWIFTVGRFLFSPLLSEDWQAVGFLHLFVMRLPILLADIAIYVILSKWLETKERKVLWLYWASPILFFINYFHGQLDVLPVAALFTSLVFLFHNKPVPSAILLGIGIAIKTHLIAVVPFYFIYLLINRRSFEQSVVSVLLSLGTFALLILPFLGSIGFVQSVFGTEEAAKVFLVHVPYIHNNLKLLLVPAAIAMLFFNFVSYRKINKDAFLLILGLLFTIFVVFVPPMPGWVYWSIPFFMYFFAKYQETPQFSFWFLNGAFLAYFFLSEDSTFLSSFQLISPSLAEASSPYDALQINTINAPLVVNTIFTFLIAALVMNAVWIYRMGVRSNLEYKVKESPFIIGIGGDSGAGKNTLAALLARVFGSHQTVSVEGDDAHRWERHDEHWKSLTHLNPKSNRLHEDLTQTVELKNGRMIQRSFYDHGSGKFTLPNTIASNRVIIYVGLHPFYLSEMRRMFDMKIYVEPDEQLRRHWKILRDAKDRGRAKEEVLKQIDAREDDANKYIRPQREFADSIFSFFPKEELQDGVEPLLLLRATFDNSVNVESFIRALEEYAPFMQIRHWYEDDLRRQTIEFDGSISRREVNVIAYDLIPNLEELTSKSPDWGEDYDGLRQLLILFLYSEQQNLQNV